MKVPLHALLLSSFIFLGACATPSGPGVLDEAALLTEAGDYDGAVIVLEEHLVEAPDDVAAWRELGRAFERLVNEGGGSWLAMNDAAAAWEEAVGLDPDDVDTLQAAAQVRFDLGEYDRADELTKKALTRIGGATLPEGLPALRMRSRIGAFQVAEHDSDEAWLEDLRATFDVLRTVRRAVPDDGELAAIPSEFIDWLGMPDVAVGRIEVELEAFADEVALHRQLIDIHVREGVDERLPPVYDDWLAGTESPTLVWYAGYVARLHGDFHQRERRFERARGAYAKCIALMEDAAGREPSYRESAETFAHQARISIVWCHLEEKDLDTAEAEILELLATVPERREEPDGLGRSLMNACAAIGQRRVELAQFERAARVSQAVVDAVPDDGEWWNNLGFLLREYGTQMENGAFPAVDDNEERAKEIFRRSWKAYRRAAELKPDDARVVNDGALIQVYHVQEELELAEEILRRAIEIGEAQLAAMGPEPDEAERFPVAQAVGDAYQNLAYLYYHLLDKQEESRELWVASMTTDSGDRSMFQPYLDHIDGQGDPVPERVDTFVDEPKESLPPRADVPWEASFDEALAISKGEQRPLVMYNRGEALGLAIPFLDSFASGERFAERTASAVVLVADAQRHDFVDRRRDGTKLECSKWGAITCSDHVTAYEEFGAWFRERNAMDPGESEEGIWTRDAGQEELQPMEGFGFFQEGGDELPEAVEGAAATKPLSELSPAKLVDLRRRAARDELEARLYEQEISPAAAQSIAEALAADEDPVSLEMLGVMAWQPRPIPALAALRAWPEGEDPGAAVFASRWAESDEVRRAADAVVVREIPDFARVLLARKLLQSR